MNPQLSQQDLAAWIDREGLAFEARWNRRMSFNTYRASAKAMLEDGYEIRLAPGALNEWNLPHGTEPHNPDGLTPEQITEGGKWRACVIGDRSFDDGQFWSSYSMTWTPAYNIWINGSESHTYRVPITTPLPAVKESLTPQPATAQSKTPRTDAELIDCGHDCGFCHHERWHVPSDFARTPEAELNAELAAALAERQDFLDTLTAIYAKLDIKEDDVPGTEKVSDTVQRYVTAALAERDEARRLLHDLNDNPRAMALLERYAPGLHTQITNHLKTA